MDNEILQQRIKAAQTLGGSPRFYELLLTIAELHSKKNHDYSQESDPLSNLRESERFGVPAWKGALVRITDKFSRIVQLAGGKTPQIKAESITDTLIDMAIYSLLTIVLFEQAAKK